MRTAPPAAPIAIVIPWFGASMTGGAEQHAWQLARRLKQRGHTIEVLTTCSRAFTASWSKNHWPAGVREEDGLTVRRFPVDPRNERAFADANGRLLGLTRDQLPTASTQMLRDLGAVFFSESINSAALIKHIAAHREHYSSFIFIPYLYGTTVRGIEAAGDKAVLNPCLHDECYAYLPEVAQAFYRANRVLCISAGEAQLAAQLFGPAVAGKTTVTGAGVEIDNAAVQRLPSRLVGKRFLLCLGRRDATKNTDFLVSTWQRFQAAQPDRSLTLVLAGSGPTSYDDEANGIVDLGLVEDGLKLALLQSCTALLQPSTNESYSRVMMEAWRHDKPVVVHSDCLATAVALDACEGGWKAGSVEEWHDVLAQIEAMPAEGLQERGQRGHSYALQYSDWDNVISAYERTLPLANAPARPRQRGRAVHQVLPTLSFGDAISNQALWMRDALRAWGFESDIYAKYLDPRLASEQAIALEQSVPPSGSCLLYHHSIGTPATQVVLQHSGPKALYYHNITPAEFFEPYKPAFAELLRQGRTELKSLARYFKISSGVSTYNAEELERSGYADPSVLPIVVQPQRWREPADPNMLRELNDGLANIVFVGRVAPNKAQHHLVEAFYQFLRLDVHARLLLVGYGDPDDPYVAFVKQRIADLNIGNRVLLMGGLDEAGLHAIYRSAHLFWSMSEHEGFCVPIIEAMWFDVPVLAYSSSAIPETLAEAGLMFTDKTDMLQLAALAKLLIRDDTLRRTVVEAQRERRKAFLPDAVAPVLADLVATVESS